jgi:hypothetical protein
MRSVVFTFAAVWMAASVRPECGVGDGVGVSARAGTQVPATRAAAAVAISEVVRMRFMVRLPGFWIVPNR